MTEWKLYDGPPPEWTTAEWYAGRDRANHLEQPDHRERLLYTALQVRALARDQHLETAVDLGCGDGGLLSLTADAFAGGVHGYDLCPANAYAAFAERYIETYLLDVAAYPEKVTWADLAICTEFLEHLADPHGFTREIARHCRAIVASSPFTENDQVHYEFHAWAWDTAGYRALIEQAGFTVIRHGRAGAYQVICGALR